MNLFADRLMQQHKSFVSNTHHSGTYKNVIRGVHAVIAISSPNRKRESHKLNNRSDASLKKRLRRLDYRV